MTLIDQLCKMAVERYGSFRQLDMIVEECSELIKAIMKYKRNKHKDEQLDYLVSKIIEEYADVKITINQLKFIFPYDAIIANSYQKKINKLAYKLGVNERDFK